MHLSEKSSIFNQLNDSNEESFKMGYIGLSEQIVRFIDRERSRLRYFKRAVSSALLPSAEPAALVLRFGEADFAGMVGSGAELSESDLQRVILEFIDQRGGGPIHFLALENGADERIIPLIRFAHRLDAPVVLSLLNFPADKIEELLELELEKIEIWLGGISESAHRATFAQPVEPTLRLLQELTSKQKERHELLRNKGRGSFSWLGRGSQKIKEGLGRESSAHGAKKRGVRRARFNGINWSGRSTQIQLVHTFGKASEAEQAALISFAEEQGVSLRINPPYCSSSIQHDLLSSQKESSDTTSSLIRNVISRMRERAKISAEDLEQPGLERSTLMNACSVGALRLEVTSKGVWRSCPFYPGSELQREVMNDGKLEANSLPLGKEEGSADHREAILRCDRICWHTLLSPLGYM